MTKKSGKNAFGLIIALGAIGVIISNFFNSDPSPQATSSAADKKNRREERIAAANKKTPCEQALASYDTQRWRYTQSPDGPQSKWRTVDCTRYSCPGYTGTKAGSVLERSFGRFYKFLRTDDPEDRCSTNIHQFTCKFDRPRVDPAFLSRDINQVLKHIGVPVISGQLELGLSLERSKKYEYNYNDGHKIYIHVEDSWLKDCSYITSITYSRYEYK